MTNPNIVIEKLTAYSPDDAADLGVLLNMESPGRPAAPLPRRVMMDAIVDPADRTIIVARDIEAGMIVSSESLNLIKSPDVGDPAIGRIAALGFVCTHSEYRERGIFGRVWRAGLEWCDEREAKSLDFTSNPTAHDGLRSAAIRFYESHGAVLKSTNPYSLDIKLALELSESPS